MHEKTLILPILNQLTFVIEIYHRIIIEYGEYSGLTPEIILEELRIMLPNQEHLFGKLKFQITEGEIHCLECDFRGHGGQIFTEPISHTTVVISCPECFSGTTLITQGLGLKILTPTLELK